MVGKYTHLPDSYKSLAEALAHGGIANNVGVKLDWLDSEIFEQPKTRCSISKASTASWCRAASASAAPRARSRRRASPANAQVPYFGICFGMQMAVIEAARHLAGLNGAGSTEFGPCAEPVIGLMTEWMRGNELEQRQRQRRSRRHHAAWAPMTAMLAPG